MTKVEVSDDGMALVTLTPTFSGCPALKVMEQLVHDKLIEIGFTKTEVKTSFDVQWNTNMISEKGLLALKKHGLAPPPKHEGYFELDAQPAIKIP